VCWRAANDNPWYLVPVRAAETVVAALAPAEPGAPGPFSFADEARLGAVLGAAGFTRIAIERHDSPICTSTTGLPEAVEFSVRAGPVSRMLLDADAGTATRVRAAITRALSPHVRAERVELGASVWIATAVA
jgi:hypothetical protein